MKAQKRQQRLDRTVEVGREDRRSGARVLTVYRVARVKGESDAGLCRVQNVSDGGLMLVTGLALAEGDKVEVAFSEGVVLEGAVAWQKDAQVGIRFTEEVDAARLLQLLAAERGSGQHRPIRLPVDTLAVVYTAAGSLVVAVSDISQYGLKVRHDGSLEPDAQVRVVLSNGTERRGLVRWSRGEYAGLRLIEPIDVELLASAGNL